MISEYTLEPATGKALPVLKGQIIRLLQVEGEQCIDFNAYNLHDYKEHFSAGNTRRMSGMFPSKGGMLWSATPRDRPMFIILEDTVGANDLNFCRCSSFLWEWLFGYEYHTNCQDTLAEAIREYGLTPDDTHDTFNFFMRVVPDEGNKLRIKPNIAKKGDYMDLLAVMDCLVALSNCGNDVTPTSNYQLHPVKAQVFEGSRDTERLVKECESTWKYKNQKTVVDFKVKEIKRTRELRPDPNYKPDFRGAPIKSTKIGVELNQQQIKLLEDLVSRKDLGKTYGEVLRSVFIEWCREKYMAKQELVKRQ